MNLDLRLSKDYTPAAIYYNDSDSLEYLREAEPHYYRRIDSALSLIFSLQSNEFVGFKIKGFRNFYIRNLKDKLGPTCPDFIELVDVLKSVTEAVGSHIFEQKNLDAYNKAIDMAAKDNIRVKDLPKVAI